MADTNPKDVYLKRKDSFEKLLKRQKKTISLISLLRLFAMILAVYFIVLAVKSGIIILWAVSAMLIILFFVLVSYYKNQYDKRRLLEKLIVLNIKEISCLENDFSGNRSGEEFNKTEHPWAFDLDLFGDGSFYQYINRTATHLGPKKLADYVSNSVLDLEEINIRQSITRELSEKINLRQHFIAQADLMDIREDEFREIISWSAKPVFIEAYKWTRIAAWLMSVVSGTILITGIFNPEIFKLLIPDVLINFTLLSPFLTKTGRFQFRISKKHTFLKTYSLLLNVLSKENFSNSELQEMKKKCENGSAAIKKLSELLDLFDQRLNLLMGFVLNGLFLFDFFMLHKLAKWNNLYKNDFENWLEIVGKSDALFSLAGFAYNHPANVYPQIENEYIGLSAVDLGHPMIPIHKRVNNSIEIDKEKVVLISGANMAGKSTFLRSLGINMILSYAGCPVCAKSFKTGNYQLFSSMRTSDSLKDEESYFFAEIKRLKLIVDHMKAGRKMLILLDEVLKGTNTTDKQKGSRGLIEKSVKHNVLCFIATHDLSLGVMQEEHKGKIVNYCFESYINELDLTFDYKIMPGLAKNMNASFLMKKMGIMD